MVNAEVMAAVPCPQCEAAAGQKCRGMSGIHPKRRGKAEALVGWRRAGAAPTDSATRKRWREAASGPRRQNRRR
jgi:hypothetical protein